MGVSEQGHFDIDDIFATAHAIADVARIETLRHFRTVDLKAENKSATQFDPVTVADRSAENAMRDIIRERRPLDSILGEEFDRFDGTSGLTWVLDPIDGTRAYICGAPTWGVLIAVSDETGPRCGIIDQPYIGERFIGGPEIAQMDGPLGLRDLAVSQTTSLAHAKLMTTYPEVGTAREGAAFAALAKHVKQVRYGLDCYAYALLAAGQIDLVVEAGLQSYDIQAPIAVIEAAGGIVTDWNGGRADGGGTAIAAATPALHQAAMEILQGATLG